MSDRKRQQRAALIVGGAAVGGLAIIGLAIALSSGDGDDKNSIDTSRTTTSSSSTSSSSTSTSTTTLITLPPTLPITTTPPTTAFFPTTAPPTEPPTQPPTQPTSPPTTAPPTTQPSTTSTTKPLTPAQQLALDLGTVLNGGVPPEPGQNRVTVQPLAPNKTVVVTWKLNTALTPDEQATTARQEAFTLLQNIQTANPPGNDTLKLRASIPDPDGTGTDLVVRLTIDRQQFDAFDFTGVDPLTVFELPFVTQANIDEDVVPPIPGTTTTTDDPTTTTTTDPDEEPPPDGG
jgi:hypothetical protein